jgi:dihydrofolate reductase
MGDHRVGLILSDSWAYLKEAPGLVVAGVPRLRRTNMAKVILGATMSLDGFINDRLGSVAALYPDLDLWRDTEPGRESIQNTGAVVMGRNSFAMAEDPDSIAGDYEYQVPIFVLTHEAPKQHPKENDRLTFTFVTDGIESAVALAKAAAGDKDVNIIGAASTAHQCLKAGIADELHIDIMPILLCSGLRLFEDMDMESIRLERMKVVELPSGRTHMRFRIVNGKEV